MCGLIVLCRRFGRDPGKSPFIIRLRRRLTENPDNIAPPIAACLGDLVTLCLVGVVSAALINFVNTPVPFILVLLVILSSFSCALFTHRNPFVKDLIKQGWSPLFGAMVISSGSGIVLDLFASRYEGFPLLAIVISGLFSFHFQSDNFLTWCY
jgi:solute carrier family 41